MFSLTQFSFFLSFSVLTLSSLFFSHVYSYIWVSAFVKSHLLLGMRRIVYSQYIIKQRVFNWGICPFQFIVTICSWLISSRLGKWFLNSQFHGATHQVATMKRVSNKLARSYIFSRFLHKTARVKVSHKKAFYFFIYISCLRAFFFFFFDRLHKITG